VEFEQANAGLRAMQAGRQPWDAPPAPARQAAPAPPDQAPDQVLAPTHVAAGFGTWRPGPIRETAALLGAPAGAVTAALGPPELRRPEGDAETWLYRGRRCLLDVVLYPDPATRQPRVGHAAARSQGVERVTEETCLAEIVAARSLARLR
jgi:hypothetical protein